MAMEASQSIPADSVVRLGTRVNLELTQERALIDTMLVRRERARVEAEEALLREQEIADSLALLMVDSLVVVEEPAKRRVERVDIEDLFN